MRILQKIIFYFIITCYVLLASHVLYAQKTIFLEEAKTYKVGKSLLYYEDVAKVITFDKVLADSNQQIKWQASQADNLNFGLNLSAVWVKINFQNTTGKNDWLLEVAYPALDTVEVYQKINGTWQKKLYSDRQPFHLRDIQHHNYVIPLALPDTTSQIIYIRAASGGSLTLPIDVLQVKTFTEKVATEEIGFGVYYGIMLCMLLYNLFIFLSLRDKSYIYYIVSIISTTLFLGNVKGHTFQHLFPNFIELQNTGSTFGMLGWVASSALFTISFLKSEKYTKVLTKILYVNVGIGVIGVLATPFAPYSIITRIAAAMVGLNALIIFTTTITNTFKGNQIARYFTLAWTFFLACVVTIVLSRAGILPTNFFTINSIEIGSAVEVILLSFALSDRYKLLKRANEKLQLEALKTQKEANETLEINVKARTIELQETVEELNQINEELQSSVDVIKDQKRIIEKKNTDIMSSIQYARRIQTAMLPVDTKMQEWLPEHFIFLKPRDVVSGDFYWAAEKDGKIFIAAADCTGHGVPGALMSMVGINILNEIVNVKKITQTDNILAKLRKGVITTLQQDTTDNRDGMDIAICVIDKEQRTVEYSGANNGLFYVKTVNGEAISTFIKADKMSIGGMQTESKEFTKHIIKVPQGEKASFYIYSDGYQDQFGGVEGKKLLVRGFHQLLVNIHQLQMQEQKNVLQEHLTTWLNESNDQIDDILVIGFEI